jgi:CxxC motif-containing protein
MRELVCIVCPRGCSIRAEKKPDGTFDISGNTCRRGYDFAVSELTAPMRTICSTVKTDFSRCPVVPVRVSRDIPKERIFDVMREINRVKVTERLGRGDAVIKNVLGLGADVIITSDILKWDEVET